MRGRGERTRVEELEDQLIMTRVMARRLWNALRARTGLEAEAIFTAESMRIADPVFDAAETVWERQRIHIQPCRTVLDPGGQAGMSDAWPVQGDMYLATWPDGNTRNLTRDQVLMMGGVDPCSAPQ